MEDFEDDSFENYEPEEEYNDEHESFHEPNHEEHLDEPIYIPSSMNDDEEVHQQQQEYPSTFGDDIYGNIYDDDEIQNSKEFHHPSKESDHIIAVATIQENVNQSEEKIVTNTSSHVLEEEDESFEDFEDHHDEEEQDSAKIQLSTQNIIPLTATCQEHLTTTTSQHKTETDQNHSTILNSSSASSRDVNIKDSTCKISLSAPKNSTCTKSQTPPKKSDQKKPFSTVQEYDYTPYYQKRQKPYNEQEIKEYMKRKKAQEEKLSKQRQESTVVTPYYLARKKPYDEEKVKEFMKMKQERDRKKQEEQKQEIVNNKKRRKELLKKLDEYVHDVFKELRENASKEKTVSSSKNKPEMPEFLKKQLEQEEKSSHQVMDPRKRVKEYGKKVREKLAEDHEKIMAERRLAKKIALEKKRREMHHLKLDLHMSHFKLRESDEQSEDSTWSNWSAPAKLSDLDPKTYKSKSDKYCFTVTNSVIQQDGERIDSDVNNNTTSKEQDEQRRKIIEEALSLIAAAKQQPSQKEQVSNPTLPANESFSKLNTSENQEFQQPDIISKSDIPVLNNCSSSNNNFSTAIQSLIMNLSRKTSSKEIQVSEAINSQTHSETNHKPETPNMFGDEKKNESHSLVMNGQPENKHLPETISLEHDQEQPSCRIEYFERAQLRFGLLPKSDLHMEHSTVDSIEENDKLAQGNNEDDSEIEFASYTAPKKKNLFNDAKLREQVERHAFWADTNHPELSLSRPSSSIHVEDVSDSSMTDTLVIVKSEETLKHEKKNKKQSSISRRRKHSSHEQEKEISQNHPRALDEQLSIPSNSSVKKSPRLLLQKKPSSKLIPQDFETTTQTIHEIQSKEMNDSCEIPPNQIPTPLTISENDHDNNNHSENKQSIPVQPLESCKTLTIEDDDQSSEASFSNEFYTKKDEIKKMVFSLMKKQETHPNKKKKEKHTKKLISLLNPGEVTQDDPFNIISTIREKKKQEELLERKRRKEKVKQELATLKQERKERMQQQLQNKQNLSTQENQNSSSPNEKCQNESGTHVGIQTYPQVTIEYDFEKDEEGEENACHRDQCETHSYGPEEMYPNLSSPRNDEQNYYYTSQTFNQQHVPLLNYWDYSHPPSFYPHGMETSIPMSNAPLLGTERIIENLVDERLSPSELAEKLLDSLTVYEKVLESEARFTSLLALNN